VWSRAGFHRREGQPPTSPFSHANHRWLMAGELDRFLRWTNQAPLGVQALRVARSRAAFSFNQADQSEYCPTTVSTGCARTSLEYWSPAFLCQQSGASIETGAAAVPFAAVAPGPPGIQSYAWLPRPRARLRQFSMLPSHSMTCSASPN